MGLERHYLTAEIAEAAENPQQWIGLPSVNMPDRDAQDTENARKRTDLLGMKHQRKREAANSMDVTAGKEISESGHPSSLVRCPPRDPQFFSVPSVSLW